jgi:hypothetical protein
MAVVHSGKRRGISWLRDFRVGDEDPAEERYQVERDPEQRSQPREGEDEHDEPGDDACAIAWKAAWSLEPTRSTEEHGHRDRDRRPCERGHADRFRVDVRLVRAPGPQGARAKREASECGGGGGPGGKPVRPRGGRSPRRRAPTDTRRRRASAESPPRARSGSRDRAQRPACASRRRARPRLRRRRGARARRRPPEAPAHRRLGRRRRTAVLLPAPVASWPLSLRATVAVAFRRLSCGQS